MEPDARIDSLNRHVRDMQEGVDNLQSDIDVLAHNLRLTADSLADALLVHETWTKISGLADRVAEIHSELEGFVEEIARERQNIERVRSEIRALKTARAMRMAGETMELEIEECRTCGISQLECRCADESDEFGEFVAATIRANS